MEAGATEKVCSGHAFFACELQFQDTESAIRQNDAELTRNRSIELRTIQTIQTIRTLFYLCPQNLENCLLPIGGDDGCPCSGIWAESTDKVVGCLDGVLCPVYLACFAENLGCWTKLLRFGKLFLWNGLDVALSDVLDGLENEFRTKHHEAVVNVLDVVVWTNGDSLLLDDLSGVDVLVEEECCDACLGVAIDDCPVDWGCSTILWQKGCVKVECAKLWHCPDDLGKHAECNDYLQVGFEGSELGEKIFVLELLRLENWDTMLDGALLDRRSLQLVLVASNWFVGHGDYADYVVFFVDESLKGGHGKIGGAHVYDSEVFLVHSRKDSHFFCFLAYWGV